MEDYNYISDRTLHLDQVNDLIEFQSLYKKYTCNLLEFIEYTIQLCELK